MNTQFINEHNEWRWVAMFDQKHCRESGIRFVERHGVGAPIVFLHGIGSNAGSFLPLFQALPDHLHLIAWNAPGYSGSREIDKPWPVAKDYAQALAGFLDALALPAVRLLGHSLGTLVAAEFARLFPERVDRLVLAAAAAGYGLPVDAALDGKLAARLDDLATMGAARFAKSRAPRLVFAPEQNRACVAKVEAAMSRITPSGYGQAVRMLASGDLAGSVAQLQAPPDFLLGAEDQVTPRAQTDRVMAAWSAAHGGHPRLSVIEGAGHAVYVQKPEQCAAAICGFFGVDAPSQFSGDMRGKVGE